MEEISIFVNPINKKISHLKISPFEIDTRKEKIVEQISGTSHQPEIQRALVFSTIFMILSLNLYFIPLNLLVYIIISFTSKAEVNMILTKNRLVSKKKSKYESLIYVNVVLMFLLLIGNFLFLFINIFKPNSDSTFTFFSLFLPSNIAKFINSFYFLFVSTSQPFLTVLFLTLATSITHVWIAYSFAKRHDSVAEIHINKIFEQITSLKKAFSPGRRLLLSLICGPTILFSIFFLQPYFLFAFWIITAIVIVSLYFSKDKEVAFLSFYGGNSHSILSPLIIEVGEFRKLRKVSAFLFNFTYSVEPDEKFPGSIIPQKVGSIYSTGQIISYERGLKWGKYAGAGVFVITCVQVFYTLFTTDTENWGNILTFLIFLILVFSLFWFLFDFLVKLSFKYRNVGWYLIGESFHSLYTGSQIWIFKKKIISGVIIKRFNFKQWFHFFSYDRINGISLAWSRLAILFCLSLAVFFFLRLYTEGGIYFAGFSSLTGYYLTYTFRAGLDFLGQAASVTLIVTFGLWLCIIILSPRIYNATRPKFTLDLKSVGEFQVLMKDIADLNEIFSEVNRSLAGSKIYGPKSKKGRPGVLGIIVKTWSNQLNYVLKVGEDKEPIKPNGNAEKSEGTYFRVSGKSGVAQLPLEIYVEDNKVYHTELEILKEKNTVLTINIEGMDEIVVESRILNFTD